MKKILLLIVTVLMSSLPMLADVAINATNFPDANFRSYLNSQYSGEVITTAQLNARDSLKLSYKGISNMKGVEYFTQLTYLDCYSNNLTSINVSANTKLKYLNVGYNQMTSIDVSANTALEQLYLQHNNFTTINVSSHSSLRTLWVNNNPNLTGMYCWRNALTNFDVSNCTSLKWLKCYNNANLATITGLASCTALTYLDCEDCSITSLDAVSGMPNLETLLTQNNKLSTLTVSGKSHLNKLRVLGNKQLTELVCYSCALTSLNVSGCTALTTLKCYYNYNLASIDGLADCTALTYLDCEDCAITSLTGVNGMTNLNTLLCRNNQLTELFIEEKSQLTYLRASGNTALQILHCRHCNLYSLDVTGCTSMFEIDCNSNPNLTSITGLITCSGLTYFSGEYCALTSLDMTHSPNLQKLYCYHNQLTSLDVTGLTKLDLLNCMQNYDLEDITGLDDCTKIYYLECSDCALLDLAVNRMSDLRELYCRNNKFTTLILSPHPELKILDASRNQLLEELCSSSCSLTYFNVYNCPVLEHIECDGNQLTELDVSTCPSLKYFFCDNNLLTELDVSNNHQLRYLWCKQNQLTRLDLSTSAVNFRSFDCSDNQLSGTLDVSRYALLYQMACDNNQFSQLVLGNHNELVDLWCNINQLTSLNISGCSALEYLDASENQLTSLDASNHSALWSLYAHNNQLTSLKVDNCPALSTLSVFYNKIKTGQMGQITAALPTLTDDNKGTFYAIVDYSPDDEYVEENIITVSQVNEATAKYWNVCHWNWGISGWELYSGSSIIPGDVNGDTFVTIADVSALIDYLLNGDDSNINIDNANVNGDSDVGIADVSALIDMLLSGASKVMMPQVANPASLSPMNLASNKRHVLERPRKDDK
jgi:Leucine-rich repeat (LRR) protein